MRVLLRNPAPADPADRGFWGDAFFGAALARSIAALGCRVETQFWPDWHETKDADVLLVLRGIRQVHDIAGEFRRTAIWIISHPEMVSDEESSQFDFVFSGSVSHCEQLGERGFNAHLLLQCTDPETFLPPRPLSDATVQCLRVRG